MVIDCLPDGQRRWPKSDNTLNDLAKEVNVINRANGWNVIKPEEWPDDGEPTQEAVYHLGMIIALFHSEASEALEAIRHNDKENFKEELADIVIRVLDCAGGLNIDLDQEVRNKMDKNRKRAYKHGGKLV